MAYDIRERLKAKKLQANYKAVEVVNKYLFDEVGFTAVKDANDANDLFLHTVLDKKHGYCLSLSVLYLAIGERAGTAVIRSGCAGAFFRQVRRRTGEVQYRTDEQGRVSRTMSITSGNSRCREATAFI